MAQKRASQIDLLVAQKIRAYRLERRLSQSDLAEKLGVTFQQVQKYERGVNRVGAGRLFEIAQLLSVSIKDLYPNPDTNVSELNSKPERMEDLVTLASSIDTLLLVKSFAAISDPRRRKRILALVQDVAATENKEGDAPAETTPQ